MDLLSAFHLTLAELLCCIFSLECIVFRPNSKSLDVRENGLLEGLRLLTGLIAQLAPSYLSEDILAY